MSILVKSPLIRAATELSAYPLFLSDGLQEEGIPGEIGARLLFALQVAISLAALPIILFVGLLEAAFHAITSNEIQALETFQATMTSLTLHVIMIAPYSFVGIFSSKEMTSDTGHFLERLNKEVAHFWFYICCQSDNPKATA